MTSSNYIVHHSIPPLFDDNSKILVLGSFPSVKSREETFYYMHPQNRFWPMLADIFDECTPDTVEKRRIFALSHRIALFDVVKTCKISGSSDSSLKALEMNDLSPIFRTARIKAILVNGRKAYSIFIRNSPDFSCEVFSLPSTSPANAAFDQEYLVKKWGFVLNHCLQSN